MHLCYATLNKADLSGASLIGSTGKSVNLSQTNLRNAELDESRLPDVDLRGANLTDASLIRVDLRGANLAGTTLKNTNLMSADVRDVNFEGATFDNTEISRTLYNTQTKFGFGGKWYFASRFGNDKPRHTPTELPVEEGDKHRGSS